MGKYNVKFSCGHEETIKIFGKVRDRMKKIEYYEARGLCSGCMKKKFVELSDKRESEMAETHDIRRMKYYLYKSEYSDCETRKNSYDSSDKTIVVYIPKKNEKSRELMKKMAVSSEKFFHDDDYFKNGSIKVTASSASAVLSKKSGYGSITITLSRSGNSIVGKYRKEWFDNGHHNEERNITSEELKEIYHNSL